MRTIRAQSTRKNGRMWPSEMDVSARLPLLTGIAAASPQEQDPSNELTTTSSKFSPAFRSAKFFQTTWSSAGPNSRCSSPFIIKIDSSSKPRAGPAYKASVRDCAFAETDTTKTSNRALNVHNMVILERHYISGVTKDGKKERRKR